MENKIKEIKNSDKQSLLKQIDKLMNEGWKLSGNIEKMYNHLLKIIMVVVMVEQNIQQF